MKMLQVFPALEQGGSLVAHDGTLVLYFHPRESSPELPGRAVGLKVPRCVRADLGPPMLDRLEG